MSSYLPSKRSVTHLPGFNYSPLLQDNKAEATIRKIAHDRPECQNLWKLVEPPFRPNNHILNSITIDSKFNDVVASDESHRPKIL